MTEVSPPQLSKPYMDWSFHLALLPVLARNRLGKEYSAPRGTYVLCFTKLCACLNDCPLANYSFETTLILIVYLAIHMRLRCEHRDSSAAIVIAAPSCRFGSVQFKTREGEQPAREGRGGLSRGFPFCRPLLPPSLTTQHTP